MERTKRLFPDAINCSSTKNFTQIPNEVLKNSKISLKAKIILFILLSNKEGWHSYISSIEGMIKEGQTVIQTALKELENLGYLLRIKYREKDTKVWRGSFWAYTDIPFTFNLEEHFVSLTNKGLEPNVENPYKDIPNKGNPYKGNQPLIIYNNKNINNKNIKLLLSVKIKKSQFNNFWKIYPKKTDKGKAKTKWDQLCNKLKNEKPDWKEIKLAIINQKKSDRWQNIKFIPNPTTWLNQSRWLDDPKEMVSYDYDIKEPVGNRTGYTGTDFGGPDEVIE